MINLHKEEAAVEMIDPYREATVGESCLVYHSRSTALECNVLTALKQFEWRVFSSRVVPRYDKMFMTSLHDYD